jgi:hypothetical protein
MKSKRAYEAFSLALHLAFGLFGLEVLGLLLAGQFSIRDFMPLMPAIIPLGLLNAGLHIHEFIEWRKGRRARW